MWWALRLLSFRARVPSTCLMTSAILTAVKEKNFKSWIQKLFKEKWMLEKMWTDAKLHLCQDFIVKLRELLNFHLGHNLIIPPGSPQIADLIVCRVWASGIITKSTMVDAKAACMATKPASRPMSFTMPTPLEQPQESVWKSCCHF